MTSKNLSSQGKGNIPLRDKVYLRCHLGDPFGKYHLVPKHREIERIGTLWTGIIKKNQLNFIFSVYFYL